MPVTAGADFPPVTATTDFPPHTAIADFPPHTAIANFPPHTAIADFPPHTASHTHHGNRFPLPRNLVAVNTVHHVANAILTGNLRALCDNNCISMFSLAENG